MKTESQNIQKVMAKILVVFVWALKDIPQHRRKPLFLQLLTTLQPDRSLWILLLILIENYVLQGQFQICKILWTFAFMVSFHYTFRFLFYIH